jgi:hypothetical protein
MITLAVLRGNVSSLDEVMIARTRLRVLNAEMNPTDLPRLSIGAIRTELVSETRVSCTITRLAIHPQIAAVGKYRCFVFQVFQGGLIQSSPGRKGVRLGPRSVGETVETRNTRAVSEDGAIAPSLNRSRTNR